MADNDTREGRNDAFGGGVTGDGGAAYIASALPHVTQANPTFTADSNINAIPNVVPTPAGQGKSLSSYSTSLFPMMAKSSPLVKAQQEEQAGES